MPFVLGYLVSVEELEKVRFVVFYLKKLGHIIDQHLTDILKSDILSIGTN